MDAEVSRDAAPNAGRRGYANVAALLRAAGNREPSPLELEFIGILLTAPHSASDNEAHVKDFLYAVLDISLKWNRLDMCTQVLQRFKALGGLSVDPKMAFDIICLVGFDIIRPCLEQLLSSDTPNMTERSLGFLGTLEHLVAESPAPEAPSDVIQAWVVVQRRRLCLELPAPEDRYDEILQHCLVHGGIAYMKQHLLPLYIKSQLDEGTFLCELGLRVDSHKGFPDIPMKREVVLELLQASVGNCGHLTAKNCQDRIEIAYAALLACLKYSCSDKMQLFFTNLVRAVKKTVPRDDLKSIAIHALFPFLTRLKVDLPKKFPSAPADIRSCADKVFQGTVNAILGHVSKDDFGWSAGDLCAPDSFSTWLKPLLLPEDMLLSIMRRAKHPDILKEMRPAPARACLHVFVTHFSGSIKNSREMTRYMDALAGHYADNVKISTPWEVAQDIIFLGKVVSKPTALTVLADRIVASGALIHSAACEDAVLTQTLASSSACRCPTKFNLLDLFRAVSNSMTSAYNSTSIMDNISPALRSLVHKWFTKHLLTPISNPTPQTLRGRLDKVQEEWVCNKITGRRTCLAIRHFICVLGGEFDSAQRLVVVGHGHNVLKHLREDLRAFLPPDIGQWGEDTNGEIWVRKTEDAMWRPGLQRKLRSYGRRLLDEATKRPFSDKGMEKYYQALRTRPSAPNVEASTSQKNTAASTGRTLKRAQVHDPDDSDSLASLDSGNEATIGSKSLALYKRRKIS